MTAATKPGRVLILNGAPRSGKSTLVALVRAQLPGRWINLGVDMHMERMLPPELLPGIGLRPGGERPDLEAHLPALYGALYDSIAAHGRAGFDVVVDIAHHDAYSRPLGMLPDCARRLAGLPVLFVGLRCALPAIMERRGASDPAPPASPSRRRCSDGRRRCTPTAITTSNSTPASSRPRPASRRSPKRSPAHPSTRPHSSAWRRSERRMAALFSKSVTFRCHVLDLHAARTR